LTSIFDEPEKLAELLTSINTKNTGYSRALLPWSCTLIMRQLLDEKGKKETISILPIQDDMFDQFLLLEKIPDEKKRSVIWNETKGTGVVFSSALKIARLKDENDKKILMGAVLQYGFTKIQTDNIVVLKNKNPDMIIEDCIEEIVKFRPTVVQSYMIVLSIKNLESHLEELSKTQNKRINEIIKNAFETTLGLSIDAVSIKGDNTAISMNEEAYRKYEHVIDKKNLADIDILPTFLEIN